MIRMIIDLTYIDGERIRADLVVADATEVDTVLETLQHAVVNKYPTKILSGKPFQQDLKSETMNLAVAATLEHLRHYEVAAETLPY